MGVDFRILKSPNGDNQLEYIIALRSTSVGEHALALTGCLQMQQSTYLR